MKDPDLAKRVVPITTFRSDGTTTGTESPGHSERCAFYRSSGVPNTRLNGTKVVSASGSDDKAINDAIARIKAAVSEMTTTTDSKRVQSAFKIEPILSVDNYTGNLKVNADVTLVGALPEGYKPENTKIFFVLTATPVGIPNPDQNGKYLNATEPYRVHGWGNDTFTTLAQGTAGAYEWVFQAKPEMSLQYYNAVVFLQHIETEYNNLGQPIAKNPVVYQTASCKYEESIAIFKTNYRSGYSPLKINFSDLSFIKAGDKVASYLWDMGDGSGGASTTYNIQNPEHTFNTAGKYTITLTINLEGGSNISITETEYIWVYDKSEGVIGNVFGVWKKDEAIKILGDLCVAKGDTLKIEAGVNIDMPNNAEIVVYGDIQVRGTKDEPVTFTSTGTWSGIYVRRMQGDPVNVAIPAVHFEYTKFEKSTCALRVVYRDVNILNCEFTNNKSAAGSVLPSAISFDRVPKSNVFESVFMNNEGGTITLDNSNMHMRNCIVVNNSGVDSGAFMLKFNCTITVENCTIWNNVHTATSAGTMHLQSTGNNVKLTVLNSILQGAPPIYLSDTSGRVNMSYTAYFDTSTPVKPLDAPVFTVGQGMIYKDESFQFADVFDNLPTTAGHSVTTALADWVLKDGSIAIDKGQPVIFPGASTDIEDPAKPGFALHPAKGAIRTDLGFYGGKKFQGTEKVIGKLNHNAFGANTPVASADIAVFTTGSEPIQIASQKSKNDGTFELPLNGGSYTLKITHSWFSAKEVSVPSVVLGVPTDLQTIELTVNPTVKLKVTGKVKEQTTSETLIPVVGADVIITKAGELVISLTSGEEGEFEYEFEQGTFEITIKMDKYDDVVKPINITYGTVANLGDIEIRKKSSIDEEPMLPRLTVLRSNYPNPFNPVTNIAFDIAKDSNVKIEIFNIKGQKVKTLLNDNKKAGKYSVQWNGVDDNNHNVGSGIYFYRMETENYTATNKMLLMK